MYDEVIKLTGTVKGKTSFVLVGVHGNEKCGVIALQNILPNLKIDAGTVYFAYGNPRAIIENTRFTEQNLNRMFKLDDELSQKEKESYEYERAQYLKEYLNKAEVLLDVHASSIPNSRAFIICENNASDITKYLPIELVVTGFDDVEPGATDYYMNQSSKVGICIECGYLNDSKAVQVAEVNIISFLKAQGHITNDINPFNHSYVHMFELYYSKTNSFTLSKTFENFEPVKKDQLIGTDGKEKIYAPKDCLILFAHNGTKIGDEVFLLGESVDGFV